MKCPDCGATFESAKFRDIDLDVCSKCESIWFDMDEVERFRKAIGRAKPLRARFDDRFRPSVFGAKRECPRCGKRALKRGRLKKFKVSKCGECFGVFAAADAMTAHWGLQNIPRSTGGEAPSLAEVVVGTPFELLFLLLD